MPIFLPTKSFGELMLLSSVMKANGCRCSAVAKALTGMPFDRARISAATDATLPIVLEPPAVNEIGSMLGPPGSILSSTPRSLNQPFSSATKSPAYWALASQPSRMLTFSGLAANASDGSRGRPSASVTTPARPRNARRESELMSGSFLSSTMEPGVPGRLAARGDLRVPRLENAHRAIGHVDRGLDAVLLERVGDAIGGHRADAAPAEAVEPEHREDRGRLHLEVQHAGALQIGHDLLGPALRVTLPARTSL